MTSNGTDEYRSWDAAYVLGSLVSSERHEFEEHLAGCAGCRAAVAELAGMPALLSALSPEEALALRARRPRKADAGGASRAGEEGPARTPARAPCRCRTRGGRGGRIGRRHPCPNGPGPAGRADAAGIRNGPELHPCARQHAGGEGFPHRQPWGTRIDWECTYTPSPAEVRAPAGSGGLASPEEYGLVVVDSRGATTQVATWTATPGTVATPTATTLVRAADIRRVEIRSVASGRTILSASV